MGKSKPKQRVTEYRLGLLYGMCVGPIDSVIKIEIDDKVFYHGESEQTGNDYVDVNLPELFGGIKKEGGAVGRVWIGYGWDFWAVPDFWAAKVGRTGATMTGYRGTAVAWFTETPGQIAGFYWRANQPYVPQTAITVSRASYQLSGPAFGMDVLWRFAEENMLRATDNPLKRGLPSEPYPWSKITNLDAQVVLGQSDPLGGTDAFILTDNNAVNGQGARQHLYGWGPLLENKSTLSLTNITIVGSVYIKRDVSLPHFSAFRFVTKNPGSTISYNHQTDTINLDNGGQTVFDYGMEVIDSQWRRLWVRAFPNFPQIAAAWIGLYPAYGSASNFPTQDDTTQGSATFFGPMMYRVDKLPTGPLVAPTDPLPYVENLTNKHQFAAPGFDSNPASIILECLRNTDFGMGAPQSSIDTVSFDNAGVTLFNENFGLSLLWNDQSEVEAFISEVLDHIEAVLFVSPLTGQLTLKLIRDDYDPDTLPIFTPDNSKVTKFGRKLYGETINEIVVTYTDPDTEEPAEPAIAQDLGNISMQGGIVSDTRNYYGVHDKILAQTLAQRDLRSAATPLASCELECNREAWALLPGDVVKLNSPEDQIESLIMRVGPVDYGKPGDPTVRASLVEDVFSLGLSEYTIAPSPIDLDPVVDPSPVDYSLIMTLPYFFAVNMAAAESLDGTAYPEALVGVLAGEEGTGTVEFDLVGDTVDAAGNPTTDVIGTLLIAAHATLPEAFPLEASTTMDAFADTTQGNGPQIGGFMLIEAEDTVSGNVHEANSELCLITAFGSGGFTYSRGVLDTVPRAWPAGTPVWFLDETMAFIDTEIRSDGEYVTYKLLPRTATGRLDADDAPEVSETITGRPWLPTRPANVKVNSVAFGPVEVIGVDPIPVTWSRRNRLTEDALVLAWGDADVTPETDQVTIVYLTDLAGSVLHTYADNSGTSQNVAVADFAGETEGYIVVKSSFTGSGALESLQEFATEIRMLIQGSGTSTVTVGMSANATIV